MVALRWVTLAYATAAAVGAGSAVLTRALGVSEHALVLSGVADVFATLVIFVWSFVLSNSSVYDPFWSVAPVGLSAYWLSEFGRWTSWQFVAVEVVLLLWSVRLTHNWVRSGAGLTEPEDWRYRDLAAKTKGAYWLVSLTGIHLFPTTVVFMSMVPFYGACEAGAAFGPLHAVGLCVSAAGVLLSLTADQQLHAFIARKRSGDVQSRVIDEGLWRYSRHPNYMGEICWWLGLLVFSCESFSNVWVKVGIAGPVALTLMFVFASVPMMEERMLGKYPAEYKAYMRRVPSAFVPWPRSDAERTLLE